jgi:hypothetical protein
MEPRTTDTKFKVLDKKPEGSDASLFDRKVGHHCGFLWSQAHQSVPFYETREKWKRNSECEKIYLTGFSAVMMSEPFPFITFLIFDSFISSFSLFLLQLYI